MNFLPAINRFYFLLLILFFASCLKFKPDEPGPVGSNATSAPKTEAELNRSVSKIIESVSSVDARAGFRISFQKNSSDVKKVSIKFSDAANPVLILSGEEVETHDNTYIFAPSSSSTELEVISYFTNSSPRSTKIVLKKNEINLIRI